MHSQPPTQPRNVRILILSFVDPLGRAGWVRRRDSADLQGERNHAWTPGWLCPWLPGPHGPLGTHGVSGPHWPAAASTEGRRPRKKAAFLQSQVCKNSRTKRKHGVESYLGIKKRIIKFVGKNFGEGKMWKKRLKMKNIFVENVLSIKKIYVLLKRNR